jgi:hypothetical protein
MGPEASRIYRYTSIGRPLDPDWPTNRAVIYLLPVALVVGAAWTLMTRPGAGLGAAAVAGLGFAMAVFLAWALGRELLPDDQAAAFVAMALGLLGCLFVPELGLITAFTTMALVRIVNRSTGLAARLGDSVLVTCLTVWALYATSSPWLGAVGALAFLLDAVLHQPLRRQWLFALACLAGQIAYVMGRGAASLVISAPATSVEWLAAPALLVFFLHALRMGKVDSPGDIGSERLDLKRVQGGMAVGALATLQAIGRPQAGVLLIATIGGLSLTIVMRHVFRPRPL